MRAAENRGNRATSATAGDADWREVLKASEPCDSLRLWNAGLAGNRAYRVVRSARGWSLGGARHTTRRLANNFSERFRVEGLCLV